MQSSVSETQCFIAVGFGANQLPVGGVAPEVGSAAAEEGSCETAKRKNQLAGIVALKRGAGQFEQKLLERLVRMRFDRSLGISFVSFQFTPPPFL
jgi:hypothetical protein